MTGRGAALIGWVLGGLLFLGLPGGLMLHGIAQRAEHQRELAALAAFDRLERILMTIRCRSDTERYLSYQISGAWSRMARGRNWHQQIDELGSRWRAWFYSFPFTTDVAGSPEFDLDLARLVRALDLCLPPDLSWQPQVQRLRRWLHRRFPGVLHLIVTDRHGRVIPRLSDRRPPAEAVRRLYEALLLADLSFTAREQRDFRLGFFEKVLPDVVPWLGNQVAPSDFSRSRRSWAQSSLTASNTWFFGMVGTQFGLFGQVDRTPDFEHLSVIDLISLHAKRLRRRGLTVGWWLPGAGRAGPFSPPPIVRRLQIEGRERLVAGGVAGQLVPVNRHLWIWATMPVATSEHGAVWQMAGLALALLGVWAAGWIVGGGREDLGLSVRWRLAALFGFAAGLPLLLLLVAGRDFLARRQLEAIRQTHQGLEIRLRAIDHGFPLSRARVAWRLRQMLSSARYDLPAVRAACHRRLEQLCLDLEGLMLFVVDTRGRKLWANAAGRVRRHSGMEGMISRLGSAVLGTLNQETGSLAGHLLISVVESFSRELDLIAECSRNLGKFQYYRIGKNPSYVFHYPLYGADRRRAIAIVTGYWFHPSCLDHYLTRRLNLDRRRFPAIGIDSAQDHSDHHPFSGGSRRVYNFRYMFAAVSYRQGTVFGARPVRGRHYLATGIRPRELEGHLLVAHVADDHLRRRAARDGWRLHAGVGGWAVITVFLGWLLGRRFLAPIRTLADGVGAIARRDFRHRLPPWDDDEFGDLVIAFNRMIEGLADIEVARIVQERLFPEPRLEVGEIRFYGATRQATELGGDYLDLLPLPDGRALFLVGDVMGHGIPAALVMAMARALIVAWEGGLVDPAATGRGTVGARQPPGGADGGAGATAGAPMTPSAPMTGPASGAAVAPVSSPPVLAPEMALQYLQDVIYANIKMKRMLTALAGIVDGVEKTIRLANAGHNFPFLRRADGSIETLKLPASMPLAPRRKAGFATMTVPLAPGDGLVVYTDGFTEAPDRNGVAIGHAAAMQAAAATWAPDPAAWFAALTAWHATQARPGPQDDDITLLLVSR